MSKFYTMFKKSHPDCGVPVLKKSGATLKRLMLVTMMMSVVLAFPAFAAEGDFDVVTTLTASFESMAKTMLGTIAAVLPIALSVLSAYICIQFGIKFFKKFAK